MNFDLSPAEVTRLLQALIAQHVAVMTADTDPATRAALLASNLSLKAKLMAPFQMEN